MPGAGRLGGVPAERASFSLESGKTRETDAVLPKGFAAGGRPTSPMGKSTVASVGGAIALAIAILGATANIAYWLYVRKGSDGHDESMVRIAESVRDLTAECDRQKQMPPVIAPDTAETGLGSVDGEGAPSSRPACDRLASASLQMETVIAERDRAREHAWGVVRYLVIWPLIGIAGLFALLRSGRD